MTTWKTSTRSSGGECVEVGADWVGSTRSGHAGNCVEVRMPSEAVVYVRDSKDPDGPVLRFSPAEWDAFVAGVRAGEFDLPG